MRSVCLRSGITALLSPWPGQGGKINPGFYGLNRRASTQPPVISQVFGDSIQEPIPPDIPLVERRLLGRARLHNIYSQEQLLSEAHIGHTHNIGTKLTDRYEYRQDLELWRLILDVNRHRRGLDGVKATWRGMKYRGHQVRLHQENATAMEIWSIFVTAGAEEDIEFLNQICWNCIEKHMLRTRLFMDVVGGLLRYQPQHAPNFAARLRFHGFQGRDDLLQLFNIACESTANGALECFRDVRSVLPNMKLYRDFISHLWQLGRSKDALTMHNYLLSKRDLPGSFDDVAPFIRHFAITEANLDPFLHGLRAAGISFESQIRRLHARETARLVGFHPETMNIVASHTFGREPWNLKDETIARALATRGFSFDFVVKFLQPFGLIEVGPETVRQLALTSADADDLTSRFDKLQELGVDTGSSTYVRILKKLSDTQQRELLHLLMKTDMHHEEFEDEGLQRTLLDHSLKKRNLHQLTRSLTILTLGETNVRAKSDAANLILRSAINLKDWTAVLQAVQLFQRDANRIEKTVVRALVRSLLDVPQTREMSVQPELDRVGLLIGILQQLLVFGKEIHPGYWVKPLLALGRLGRLDEFDRLLLWLAEYYGGVRRGLTDQSPRKTHADGDVSQLFTRTLLHAMVAWGFSKCDWSRVLAKDMSASGLRHEEPWLRGAVLLKTFRDTYRIEMDVPTLQKVFLQRVRTMNQTKAPSRLFSNSLTAKRYGIRDIDYLSSWARLWGVQVSEQHKIVL